MGCSVINLAVVGYTCLQFEIRLQVLNHQWSDQMPVEWCFSVGSPVAGGEGGEKVLPLVPKSDIQQAVSAAVFSNNKSNWN